MTTPITCGYCKVTCRTDRPYKNHFRSNTHRENVGLQPQAFPCPNCHKLYSRSSEVKRHLDDDKCSGSRFQIIARTTQSLKHRLSIGSTDVPWKHRRIRSPDPDTGDTLPQALVANNDSADLQTQIDFNVSGMPIDTWGMHIKARPHSIQEYPVLQISPKRITRVATCDADVKFVNITKTLDVQSLQAPVDLLPFEACPRGVTPSAAITVAATHTTSLETVAEAVDYDIAKSMKTLSLTEATATYARGGTETRINSFRSYPRSSHLHDSHLFSTHTNSVGSLFGYSGSNIRMPSFMRSSTHSFRSGGRSSAFSTEMPAPMGEYLDDGLRWAREGLHDGMDREHENWFRELNRQRLLRDTAEGDHPSDHPSVHQSVCEVLVHSPVAPDLCYCHDADTLRAAAREACCHSQVKVLDAIVRAFTSSAVEKYSELCMEFLSGSHEYRFLDTTTDEQGWHFFNSSLRIMIATVSCLCPQEIRPGTVCEQVASRQRFSADSSRSGCVWGDRLRHQTWPNMSTITSFSTVSLQLAFLRSLELDGCFVRRDEHVKTQAYASYMETTSRRKAYAGLLGEKLMAEEDLPYRYWSGASEDSRIRGWLDIVKRIEILKVRHDLFFGTA
jgi:hypothetical protein